VKHVKGPNSSENGKVSYIELILASVSVSFVLSVVVYIILLNYLSSHSTDTKIILIHFMAVIGMLFAAVLALSGILIRRFTRELTYTRELNSFRKYFDSLHSTSSEVEVHEVLHSFVSEIPSVSNITLFYRSDNISDKMLWQKITDGNLPLCSMNHENCPVLVRGCEYYVDSIRISQNRCPYQLPEYKAGSCICLPVIDTKHIQSILQMYSKKEFFFDPVTVFKIKSYIEIAKSTVNVKRAMHSLNKKAVTDKLTKLYNRNFLEPYLENQIEAANLSKQQLSAIMVDIDYFKKINDTYGHTVGDYILTIFAQLISKCVRKTDLIARYGGDEFIVILPSTDTATAEIIAERIREEVSEVRIPPYMDTIIPSISCSVGVSTYPKYCSTKDDLIRTSDLALYEAKQAGRNCMRIYQKETTVNS